MRERITVYIRLLNCPAGLKSKKNAMSPVKTLHSMEHNFIRKNLGDPIKIVSLLLPIH